MAWLSLTVIASEQQAELLSDTLMELGALSVDVLDADADTTLEKPIFGEPGEPATSLWSVNRVSALFPENAQMDSLMMEVARLMELAQPPAYQVAVLEDNDWVRLTQAQFNPIRISQRLWIVPTWHSPVDSDAISIVLDPGLAFGTGSHPTTRLCLRWLDDNIRGGESVLDYGCGSGILAIAALKLGASAAVGVDLDPQAVQASRDNAIANQADATFYLPDDAPKLQADIVVANILTNPLKMLAPLLASVTRKGGRIVLSGILREQAEDVMKIYSPWFELRSPIFDEDWACLSGVKQ
jgi:ribosomal protein L11 methyltransferase